MKYVAPVVFWLLATLLAGTCIVGSVAGLYLIGQTILKALP